MDGQGGTGGGRVEGGMLIPGTRIPDYRPEK